MRELLPLIGDEDTRDNMETNVIDALSIRESGGGYTISARMEFNAEIEGETVREEAKEAFREYLVDWGIIEPDPEV